MCCVGALLSLFLVFYMPTFYYSPYFGWLYTSKQPCGCTFTALFNLRSKHTSEVDLNYSKSLCQNICSMNCLFNLQFDFSFHLKIVGKINREITTDQYLFRWRVDILMSPVDFAPDFIPFYYNTIVVHKPSALCELMNKKFSIRFFTIKSDNIQTSNFYHFLDL